MRRLSRFLRKSFLSLGDGDTATPSDDQSRTATVSLLESEFDSREALQTAIRVCAGRDPSGLA
ncbi:hypothetical protein [Aquisalimonas asiatica]|uniref:Uncharacterized protein n=1 Tax=Aquisalimonas asiatica TaxID=406100 RepID=A0A1H8U064_9GAMM|nr:hypothetical protein [Aquisalimonas asiatica]SEO96436.1 hypothetical protein SAMN04488052_10566 [Aquisalimonas asiatica]